MTRTATTFDTMPQTIDLILKRMDEIEAKLDAQPAVSEGAATHIFLKEAAELVGKSPSTIYKLAGAGKIPAYNNRRTKREQSSLARIAEREGGRRSQRQAVELRQGGATSVDDPNAEPQGELQAK